MAENERRKEMLANGQGGSLGAHARGGRPLRAFLLFGVVFVLMASSNGGAVPKFSEWSAPVNLGSVVNSAFDDTQPAISKDGLSLYFGSVRPGVLGGNDIWLSQRADPDDPWGPPVNLGPPVNTEFQEGAPAFSRDGHWMFLNSNRPGGFGLNDLWVSYREHVHDDFAWRAPVNLGPTVNTAFQDQGSSYFENDDDDDDDDDDDEDDDGGVPLLFFASNRPGGLGGNDIYVSAQQPDGSFGAAEHLEELSSSAEDQRPIIRFDGLELFLFSNRVGGFGLNDVWVSTRDALSEQWNAPVNLGETVNSALGDIQAFIGPDRLALYFSSNRPGGAGGFDLYVTTRERVTADEDDEDEEDD